MFDLLMTLLEPIAFSEQVQTMAARDPSATRLQIFPPHVSTICLQHQFPRYYIPNPQFQ